MLERTLVYVDTSYLLASFYNSWETGARGQLEIDLRDVVNVLDRMITSQLGQPVQRQMWYDGIPETGPHRYQRSLRAIDGVQFRAGQLIEWGDRRTQKAVDTRLVADMVLAAVRGHASDIVLVSGDADMLPGVIEASNAGSRVHLYGFGWDSMSSALRHACDTTTILDPREDFADSMQINVLEGPIPPVVRGEQGEDLTDGTGAGSGSVSDSASTSALDDDAKTHAAGVEQREDTDPADVVNFAANPNELDKDIGATRIPDTRVVAPGAPDDDVKHPCVQQSPLPASDAAKGAEAKGDTKGAEAKSEIKTETETASAAKAEAEEPAASQAADTPASDQSTSETTTDSTSDSTSESPRPGDFRRKHLRGTHDESEPRTGVTPTAMAEGPKMRETEAAAKSGAREIPAQAENRALESDQEQAKPKPTPRPSPSMMAPRRKLRSRYVPLPNEVWASAGFQTPFDVGQQYANWWYEQIATDEGRDDAHLLSGGGLPPEIDRPLLQFACETLHEYTLTEVQRVNLRDGFHAGIRGVLLNRKKQQEQGE